MGSPHTCGRLEDDNSDFKRAREGQNKNPPGLRWAGALKALLRYFFAVRLRVEGARGVLTGFAFAPSTVLSESDPVAEESAAKLADAGLSPPRTSAKRLAPANAQAFMASACAPIIRRTAPADSRN